MTEREIATLEANQKNMKEQLDSIEDKLDKFIETANDKYATKTSVNRLRTMAWSVIGFVFVFIGGMVLTKVLQ